MSGDAARVEAAAGSRAGGGGDAGPPPMSTSPSHEASRSSAALARPARSAPPSTSAGSSSSGRGAGILHSRERSRRYLFTAPCLYASARSVTLIGAAFQIREDNSQDDLPKLRRSTDMYTGNQSWKVSGTGVPNAVIGRASNNVFHWPRTGGSLEGVSIRVSSRHEKYCAASMSTEDPSKHTRTVTFNFWTVRASCLVPGVRLKTAVVSFGFSP
jgi:hypothetical protein